MNTRNQSCAIIYGLCLLAAIWLQTLSLKAGDTVLVSNSGCTTLTGGGLKWSNDGINWNDGGGAGLSIPPGSSERLNLGNGGISPTVVYWSLAFGTQIQYFGGASGYSSYANYLANIANYNDFGTISFDSGSCIIPTDTNSPDDDLPPPPPTNCPSCSCSGMPVWRISEPYISLWLNDEPLGYQPAVGPRVSFELAYNQRDSYAGLITNLFSVGTRWNCSWLSYVTQDLNTNNILHFPGGGQRTYTTSYDYRTNTRLTGDTTNGFTLLRPDGSQDVYGYIVTNNLGAFKYAFLTQHGNAQSQQMTYNYGSFALGAVPVVRLQSIVDGDGRTNWISYCSTNANYTNNLISIVVDAFGHASSLAYDINGNLTNIIDAASNSTAITYDTNGWASSMTTPYGTTRFAFTETSATNIAPNGRSALITRPDGSRELYEYLDSAFGVTSSYAMSQVPTTFPFANTFENSDLNLRNSFHWGPRQYVALSTTNLASFTVNDFRKAYMKHWLLTDSGSVGQTLSISKDPSPDSGGSIEGQKTWYDYVGKTNFEFEGTQALPLFTARVLPDGNTFYERAVRNAIGHTVTNTSTYSIGSSSGNIGRRSEFFLYDSNGIDLVAVTNALGVRVSCNTYNANHEIVTNYNAPNELTTYTYDGSHRVISVTHPNGLVTTNIYGADGFLAQRIDVGFATNSFTYTNDLVYTHTDPRGLATTNTWDALNRLTGTAFLDGSSISNVYTILDLTAIKDRLGNWMYFGYDSMRRKTAETNVLGNATFYNYCACGALDSIVDTMTNATLFYYDNQGNLTNTVYADNYSVTTTYNLLRQAIIATDSSGNSVTNTYNNQGLVIAVSNALGRVQSAAYDMLDRATNTVNANGVSINTTFDNLNRSLTRSYPDNGVEKWAYTPNFAAATSYTNQIGNITLYGFDALNRKTNEVSVGVTTNSYTYDGAGDLLTLTDGKNQMTTWIYDSFGRVTTKMDAASNLIFVYQYDPGNRLTNRWSIAKGSTIYKYNALGSPTNIIYPTSPAITLAYDPLNRLTNMMDAVGTTKYAWDAVGEMLSEDGPWTSDTVNYTYNNRLRTGLSVAAGGSPQGPWSQSYGYDVARRMTNITSSAGSFGYAYDAVRRMQLGRLTLPNTAVITNNYDSVARLLATALVNSGGTNLDSYAYGYNQAGQRTNVLRTLGDSVGYTYDNLGQLKTAQGKESGGTTNRLHEQFGYSYDAAGNLNQRTNNALVQSFNVNNLNELATVTRSGTYTVAGTTTSPSTNVTVNTSNAVLYADTTFAATNFTLANGNNTFTAIAKDVYGRRDTNVVTVNLPATNGYAYDLNGNMITIGNQVLDYDDENQLARVTVTNQFKKEFVYDGVNRLRIRKEFTWNGGTWVQTNEIHYVYDGNVVIQLRDTNNVPTLTLTRGLDLSGSLQGAGGIGGLLAMTESSGTHSYYHGDGNGNVTALISASQFVVGKAEYDSFGNFLSLYGTKTAVNPFWFSSELYDSDTGFIHYPRRVYIPELQRWLNRDPIQEAGGLNLYGYVGNNPINFYDPYGLVQWGMLGRSGVGAVVSGVGAVVGWAAATTGVGTIPGGALGLYSSYQFGANVGNMINAFGNGEAGPAGPAEAVTTLATDNKTALNCSKVADLAIPFALSFGAVPEWSRLPTIPVGPVGTIAGTLQRVPNDPNVVYPILNLFQYADAALTVNESWNWAYPSSPTQVNQPPTHVTSP